MSVTGSLRDEIQQKRPFEAVEVEVYLNVLRTEDQLSFTTGQVLKAHGLSQPQYNVLRILRGAGVDGLPCSHIADRMVARVPDITRLLDRLASAGLVTRSRCSVDGRRVIATATEKALMLLAEIDAPLLAAHRALLGHLSDEEKRTLIQLLEKARHGKADATADSDAKDSALKDSALKDSANSCDADA